MIKVKGHTYRICSGCGREWNVSKLAPTNKPYVCPDCWWNRHHTNKGKKGNDEGHYQAAG